MAGQTDNAQWPLAAWYADPLDGAQAEAALRRARLAEQRALMDGRGAHAWRLQQMIARFWLGHSITAQYQTLIRVGPDPAAAALTELVYGQLLMSRKLQGAREHLAGGFHRAAALLAAREYFVVLRRHARLARIPLGARPAPAHSLDALLREAAVIGQLQGPPRGPGSARADTLG